MLTINTKDPLAIGIHFVLTHENILVQVRKNHPNNILTLHTVFPWVLGAGRLGRLHAAFSRNAHPNNFTLNTALAVSGVA